MDQLLLIAPLILVGRLSLQTQTGPFDLEEASEAARRAAAAAIRGPQGPFFESLDMDGLLEGRLGKEIWHGLRDRQRNLLRSAVRKRFLAMLAPPQSVSGEIAWSEAVPSASDAGVDVLLGLRVAEKGVKTRWRMRRSGSVWRVRDVLLSDPGISLAEATLRTLGREPVRPRQRLRQARIEAVPRISALAVIALAVVLAAPRVSPPRRKFLYLAASVPALLLSLGGALVIGRVLTQPYLVEMSGAFEPWRQSEELALRAQREGRAEQAREFWARAIAGGDPRAPLAYQMGLAAKQRGDAEAARAAFEGALEGPEPAPGALREIAALAAEEGRLPEAERQIARYLEAAGPDPDSLSLKAIVKTELGKTAEALEAIAEARRLVGDGPRGAELEAQIRARSGDAAGAVSALRPLKDVGRLDRDALRADPAYLPIATDPAWVAFLNEK